MEGRGWVEVGRVSIISLQSSVASVVTSHVHLSTHGFPLNPSSHHPSASVHSGIGGITYWLVIFPVDCIKSAMQTDAIDPANRKYKDITSTARQLWSEVTHCDLCQHCDREARRPPTASCC